jgi:hypothetical protein
LLSLVLGAFLGVFGLNSVYAQVPRSISYQGFLLKNGQPVTGQVTLDIKIQDAAANLLYPETITTTATNGIFNVLIGGNSGTLPASMKFDEQYYLVVSVDGQAVGNPTPFTASPYALNSQTVGGIGVSVTPQAGKLLPLDANGKVPASALPQSTLTLATIDGMSGDLTGNIKIKSGNLNTLTIVDDPVANTITLNALTGGSGITKVIAGPGLQGGGDTANGNHTVTLLIGNNSILPGMIGTSSVRGSNLDQNIPQNGLYQDALGDLNVGTNGSLIYLQPTNAFAPSKANGGIGLNMNNTNNWLVVQNFLGGITGSSGIFGTLGVNANAITVNGLAEPLAAANGAVYEIIDNGDLRVTGSTTIIGNTFIGQGTNGGTNSMGTAGQSANTITGTTNVVTGTTSNSIQSPANTIGTANASSVNTIGAAGSSANTVQGLTNNLTGGTNNLTGTTNNVNATTNNVGTVGPSTNNVGVAGNATNNIVGTTNNVNATTNNVGTTGVTTINNIGTLGTTANNTNGTTNTTIGTVANNSQAPAINIGTTQVGGNTVIIGTLLNTTNTITGLTDNIIGSTINIGNTGLIPNNVVNIGTAIANSTTTITGLLASVNATTNNMGTSVAGSINNIGTATSVNTINGTTTFNGTHIVNGNSTFAGNITQTAPGTTATFLTTNTGNLTVTGTLTQSGGNATINGGATNIFGSVGGSSNTIGAAGSVNAMNGSTNTFTATAVAPNGNNFVGNINQTLGSTTLLNTQVNGTLGSTGNINLGTASSNNNIGAAGAINTLTGATNNINSTASTNFTGNIVQISGSAAFAPTAGTTNSFGTGATQTNNISTGNGTTTTIGNGSGNVNNIGTSVAGSSTNNIGDQTYLRIAGGAPSCAGLFPTAVQSELLVNGDGWFDGTMAACRLNIFGAGASCIANLNTTNFGSCTASPINLISSMVGSPTGTVDLTGMRNIQATLNIQTNNTLTIGVPGTNATNISSSNAGPASIAQQTPSVAGRIPTFQQYTGSLAPGTGPNGGGSITFTTGPSVPATNTINTPGLVIDGAFIDGLTGTYRTHLPATPVGELWVTQTGTISVTIESSAAADANTVQLVILRP